MLLTAIAISIILIIKTGNDFYSQPIFLIVIISCIFVSLLFYKLTISVSNKTIKLVYGIGLIKITKNLDKLQNVEIIKIPWYYGILIRITTEGMLYNIQGSKGIRITYIENEKTKSFMVGTPEPEKLKKVLNENFVD